MGADAGRWVEVMVTVCGSYLLRALIFSVDRISSHEEGRGGVQGLKKEENMWSSHRKRKVNGFRKSGTLRLYFDTAVMNLKWYQSATLRVFPRSFQQ